MSRENFTDAMYRHACKFLLLIGMEMKGAYKFLSYINHNIFVKVNSAFSFTLIGSVLCNQCVHLIARPIFRLNEAFNIFNVTD